MRVVSLFAGAGGLDLGFSRAGFDVVWACEYDKTIWETYRLNHPDTYLETRSVTDITLEDLPKNIDGIIGGPPCQSWSVAGAKRGINDERGQLFNDYLRLLRGTKPRFFVVENVPGMLSPKNISAFMSFIDSFEKCGYKVNFKVLNSLDFGSAQDRKRVIIIGYRNDLNKDFKFDELEILNHKTLEDVISDLPEPIPALEKNYTNGDTGEILNNEFFTGSFSSIYMSRNRKRNWNQPSFTIQASGRQAPLHPNSADMILVEKDKRVFSNENYRRLSVRECARIQGFPDNFKFIYSKLDDAYKMIGNAVPVELSEGIANKIRQDLLN